MLLDTGVYTAKKGQDISGTEYQSAGEGISDCIDFDVNVYAEQDSLDIQCIEPADLLEGIEVLSTSGIAEIIKGAGTVMIF